MNPQKNTASEIIKERYGVTTAAEIDGLLANKKLDISIFVSELPDGKTVDND